MDISVTCPCCDKPTGFQKVFSVNEWIAYDAVRDIKSAKCSFSGNAHIHCQNCGEALGIDIFDGELRITRSSFF